MTGFDDGVAGVSSLAEPVRLSLYRYVVAQSEPVTRDQAGAGVGVARHTAKFHLDRLVADGLLETDFKRPPGRSGPGAGRPTKRYRRAAREVSVTLPPREYELAGELLAAAVERAAREGASPVETLSEVAAERGCAIGAEAARELGPRSSRAARLTQARTALAAHGFEPRGGPARVELANCPFHALAQEHTQLVCGMNLALVAALLDEVGDTGVRAFLDPGADRCCVVLAAEPSPSPRRLTR